MRNGCCVGMLILPAIPDARPQPISNGPATFAWESSIPPVEDHGILGHVEVGEVRRVDDAITGFDRNKPGRPCILIRVETAPRAGAWVLPGSSKGSIGTFVPRNILPGLKKDGRFQFLPRWVSTRDLAGCPSLGCLPEPYRTRVLENANTVAVDFEVEL
jgi:hypothetical protein